MSRGLTTEIFIERAVALHGDKYDYSLVEYKNNSTKVPVICKSCSEELGEQYIFYVRPLNHLKKDVSMGPRHYSRGNRIVVRLVLLRIRRFNGATTLQSWKLYKFDLNQLRILFSFNGATTLQSWKLNNSKMVGA